MTTSNRERVLRELDGLLDTYGDVPVRRVDAPYEAPPSVYAAFEAAARSGTINSSYLWVRRSPDQFPQTSTAPDAESTTDPRVLFVYSRADDHSWTIPGGGLEPGESFEQAGHRELAEETGIEASITGLRTVQHQVAVPRESADEFEFDSVHALYSIFDAEYASGELEVQSEELYGAVWFDRVPDNRHDLIAEQSISTQ